MCLYTACRLEIMLMYTKKASKSKSLLTRQMTGGNLDFAQLLTENPPLPFSQFGQDHQ